MKKAVIMGVVLTIQTFGDFTRWYPHIHTLEADGLFGSVAVSMLCPMSIFSLRLNYFGHLY